MIWPFCAYSPLGAWLGVPLWALSNNFRNEAKDLDCRVGNSAFVQFSGHAAHNPNRRDHFTWNERCAYMSASAEVSRSPSPRFPRVHLHSQSWHQNALCMKFILCHAVHLVHMRESGPWTIRLHPICGQWQIRHCGTERFWSSGICLSHQLNGVFDGRHNLWK